ncbi:hypothetical protein K501DRAFT_246445 [Backusella circina FSU 941]|nr:hypothetical protein K501DRAFT_246445 [Backusella circina FSU 941]
MKAWEYLSSWTTFNLSSNIQKRLYQFLLRKAIGQFVQNDLDNFDIDLKNGHVELRKLELNLEKLNDALDGMPLLLERGQVESIQISFPWSDLSCGEVYLKIQGVNIDLIPVKKNKSDLNIEESSILSPSLHFADDFLKTQIDDDELKESMNDLDSEPMEGLEVLTRMIDKILSRFKIDILDTNIRIIHDGSAGPLSSCEYEQNNKKYALELCIPQIRYFDETPEFETTDSGQMDNRHLQDSSILITPVVRETIKIITIKSPTLWMVSLPSYDNHNNQYGSSIFDSQSNAFLNHALENTQFFEAEQGNSMILDSLGSVDETNIPKESDNQPYRSLLLTTVDKDNWIRIKQLNNSSPIKQLDFFVTHARVTITPKQLTFLVDLLESMTATQNTFVPPQSSQPVEGSSFDENIFLDPSSQTQKKVKIQSSLIECLILAHDIQIEKDTQSFKTINHIRLSIDDFNTRLQQISKVNTDSLYSTLDMSISKMALDEWIVKPPEASSFGCYGTTNQKLFQTKYNMYSSVIEFNDSIKYDYNKNDTFPIYSNKHKRESHEKTQIVRIRIEKRQLKLHGQYTYESSYDEDIAIDIQAFKLKINPQIVDRLENYIYGFKNLKKPEKKGSEQLSVYEDLDRQTKKIDESKRIRLKMAFIRIVLSVPDMSQVCTRNEFNDRFHSDQLSLDIALLDGLWDNQSSTDTSLASDIFSMAAIKSKPTTISVTLDCINVFLKLYDDDMTRCWFTAKSTSGIQTDEIQQPNIEIIIRDSTSITNMDTSSNIIKSIFDSINNKEQSQSEEHLDIPIEAQSESILGFKKYALQNSMFQVNCHLPTSQVNLSKKQWNKIQILQNDLLLWQPHFLQHLPSFDQSYESTSSRRYSNTESSSSEKALYSSNLFTISAILSDSMWHLHDTYSYHIEFTEFQYFTVIKHMGQNENITILDIDDLSLDDVSSDKKKLIHKAISDKMNDKRNIPAISLVSRLSLFLESDFQHKDSSITLNQLCWEPSNSLETHFVDHIIHFQKMPEEIVFIDPVVQRTKVYVRLLDSYINYIPDHSSSRGALVLDGLEVLTCIMPNQPSTDITLSLGSANIYLIDDKTELTNLGQNFTKTPSIGSREYLEAIGFLSVLKLQNIHTNIKINLGYPKFDIVLSSMDIHLGTCADSFQTLINLITYIANEKKADDSQEQSQIPPYVIQSIPDIFASVDENSFNRAILPSILPPKGITSFNYVEEYFKKDSDPSHYANIPPEKPFRKHNIRKHDDIIHVLSEDIDQFQIVDNFYQTDKDNVKTDESIDTKALYIVQVKNIHFWWKLYDGYDWDYLRADMASIHHTNKRQQRTNEHAQSGFGDKIPGYSDRQQASTSKHTSRDPSMEIALRSLSIDLKLLPSNDPTSIYLDLRIKDVEIFDHIKTSKWNKFLGYMRSSKVPRENDACMVNVELIGVRPLPDHPDDQEHRLKVELLPIRLFIDQDALYFLIKYFTFDPHYLRSTIGSSSSIKPESEREKRAIFFQFVYIHQTVLKIDYKAKHVDFGKIKDGRFAELVNLVSLDGAQLELDRIKLTGLKGWDRLADKIGEEWIIHIKNTQLGSMVSGINHIRPVVNLSKGASDMVRIPLQQYKKDGRVIHGLSRGTQSFARATAIELIKLSSKVTSGTQVALEHADGFFASNSHSYGSLSSSYNQDDSHFVYTDIYGVDIDDDANVNHFKQTSTSTKNTKSNVKNRVREYTSLDYQNISQDIESTAKTIYVLSNDQTERSLYPDDTTASSSNSIKSTKTTSSSVIKPLIHLTSAFQTILTGLRNSIDPATRIQSEDVGLN